MKQVRGTLTISPHALNTALVQIPKLQAVEHDSDVESIVSAVPGDVARDVWHSLRRIGWESPANEQKRANASVLKRWESPVTIDGRAERDAFHTNLIWWLTCDDIFIGPRAEKRRATVGERLDDAFSRLKAIDQKVWFSPDSLCQGLSHIRRWSVGQSYNSAPLGHRVGNVWHDSGKEPRDGAAYNEYFQLRFDEYTIAGAVNEAAKRFDNSERLEFTPAIDQWLDGKDGYVDWFVFEAKKHLERGLRHLRDAWQDEVKASGELLEAWKISESGDIHPVRSPHELRDWLNRWLTRVSSCIASTDAKVSSLIDEDTSSKMLASELAEASSQPGPPKRILDKAAGFVHQRTGLFGEWTLRAIHDELRNARVFLRHYGLPIPDEFDDEPVDLRAAEKQLESLIDGPLDHAGKRGSDTELERKSRKVTGHSAAKENSGVREYVRLAGSWRSHPNEALDYISGIYSDFDRIVSKLVGRHAFGPDSEETRQIEQERSGCEISLEAWQAACPELHKFPDPLPEKQYHDLWWSECFPGGKADNLAQRVSNAQLSFRTLTDAGVEFPFDAGILGEVIGVLSQCERQRQWQHGELHRLSFSFLGELHRFKAWSDLDGAENDDFEDAEKPTAEGEEPLQAKRESEKLGKPGEPKDEAAHKTTPTAELFSLLEFAMALTDEQHSSEEERVAEAKEIRRSFRRLWEPDRKRIDKPKVIETRKRREEYFAFDDLCRVADAAEQRYDTQKVFERLKSSGDSPQN